ncbi:MAG: hypothetical protein HKN44_01765 [Ilumatobacter sp.]|nr:hypothetical protein [Ilumatobacter sp.]
MTNRVCGAVLVAGALIAAGCGGNGDGARVAESVAPATEAPPTQPVVTDTTDTTEAPDVTVPITIEPPVTQAGARPEADWTLLVYVMGDNDLEPFAVQDMVEMSAAGGSDRVNVVVLADRHPDYELDGDPFGDFVDTKLFVARAGELAELGEVGELNVGSPDTLAEFIEVGFTQFPAQHHGVVLWNHGAGWPGMGPDETDGNDILDLADIDAAFTAGLAAAGVGNVDLVGFDACLMASYEVATTMAEHADYMLASEELEPGHGWNYAVLDALAADPTMTPVDVGNEIIAGFAEQARAEGTDEDITLSLVDLTAMDGLEAALGELAEPLIADPAAAAPALARAQAHALKFGANPDPSIDSFHVDLGQVAASLGASDPALAAPAAAVQQSLDALVVTTTAGVATGGATGLSVYFPPYEDVFRQGYLFLDDIPVWPDLLQSFFTAGEAIPRDAQASFVNQDGQGEYFFDEDGLNLFGTFDLASQGNLVEAEIFYGVLDESDDSIIFIGEEPAEVTTDGSGIAGAIYDLTVLTIGDGIDTDFAYLDLTFDEDAGVATLDVPLWYVAPDDLESDEPPQDVVLSLVVDAEFSILSEVYYAVDAEGTAGQLNADPDGLIFPVLLNQYPDGSAEWIRLSEQGLFARLADLEYNFEPLDPGTTIYAELVLRDYGGNTSSVSMLDVVPG